MQENLFTFNFKLSIKVMWFIIIILLAFIIFGNIYVDNNKIINAFTKARFDEFYNAEPNSIDMLFIGSSHSYCTFDPDNFDSVLETSSYQLGTPLQLPITSYYVLKDALNNQESVSTVVMELYWDVLGKDFEVYQANTFFEVLKDEQIKNEYINDAFPTNEYIKYKIPVIKEQKYLFDYYSREINNYFEETFDIKTETFNKQIGFEEYSGKGYVYCDYKMVESEYYETNQFKNYDGKKWEINDTQRKYIEKIIALCEEKGIELLFVTAPVSNVSLQLIKNYDIINETVTEFAASHNIPYIDYNVSSRELFSNENFRDDAHLNDSGVRILNWHFVDWLVANKTAHTNSADPVYAKGNSILNESIL